MYKHLLQVLGIAINVGAIIFLLIPIGWLSMMMIFVSPIILIIHFLAISIFIKIDPTRESISMLYLYAFIVFIFKLFFVDAGDGSSYTIFCEVTGSGDNCNLGFSGVIMALTSISYIGLLVYSLIYTFVQRRNKVTFSKS